MYIIDSLHLNINPKVYTMSLIPVSKPHLYSTQLNDLANLLLLIEKGYLLTATSSKP